MLNFLSLPTTNNYFPCVIASPYIKWIGSIYTYKAALHKAHDNLIYVLEKTLVFFKLKLRKKNVYASEKENLSLHLHKLRITGFACMSIINETDLSKLSFHKDILWTQQVNSSDLPYLLSI